MRTKHKRVPANYDLVEIINTNQIQPKGCSITIFYKGWYDLDDTVRLFWQDRKATVYWMKHPYKKREQICYYVPLPKKEAKHG